MYDYSKLNGRIVEIYGKGGQKHFAQDMGWSSRTCSLKLNNHVFWNQREIDRALGLLHISRAEIDAYFFNLKVQSA